MFLLGCWFWVGFFFLLSKSWKMSMRFSHPIIVLLFPAEVSFSKQHYQCHIRLRDGHAGKKTWAIRKQAAEAIFRHQEFHYRATELNCKENQIFGRDILMGIDVKKSLFLQPCSQIGLSQQVKLFQRHMSYHNSPLFPLEEGELFLMKLLRFQIK